MTTTMLAVRDDAALPGPASFPSQAETDDQLLRLWLHGRGPNTVRAYEADVARFGAFVGKPLRTVRLADVQAFADSLGHLSEASQARSLSIISTGCPVCPVSWMMVFKASQQASLVR